jgi:hypothetical protein
MVQPGSPLLHWGGGGAGAWDTEIKKDEAWGKGAVMFLRIVLCLRGSGKSCHCVG